MQNEINFEINKKTPCVWRGVEIYQKKGIGDGLKTRNIVQLIVQAISPLVATTTLT